MDLVYGIDLSYSVNKKSYNIIDATEFNKFCIESEGIKNGTASVTKIVSFGDDRYGLVYSNKGKGDDDKKGEIITGFQFDKGEYCKINDSVKKALSKIENYSSTKNNLIISNTASSQQIVIFDNTSSQFKIIDLFDKSEQEQIKRDRDYKSNINVLEDEDDEEEETKVNGDDAEKAKDDKGGDDKDKAAKEEETKEDKEKEKRERGKDSKKRRKRSGTTPKYKVKSAIKKVFKHLLLTSNGSLYEISKSFHKKYVNNNRIEDVKCDGNRCTLCLDENGVLWSFGINLFGKLGLKRNDKKQIYTNPREISIFKAYKVSDFGLTNKCCIACCANGSIYGWGSYSKSSLGKDSNIWYTPRLITTELVQDSTTPKTKQKWKVFAGFRFIILLNQTLNKLYVINTEFGYTLLDKPRNNFIVKLQSIKLPTDDVVIQDVIPSNESAIIIAKKSK